MKLCAKCHNPIEHLHKNYKTCISCHRKESPERVLTKRTDTIAVLISDFKELEQLAEVGKHYLEINGILKRKQCVNCGMCTELQGRCVMHGCPSEEVI